MPNEVAKPSARQQELEELRALPRTLMGGTRAMRAAGSIYLPPHEGEVLAPARPANEIDSAPEVIRDRGAVSQTYRIRLQRSVLWPAYARAMVNLTGKIFQKPVKLGADVPPDLQRYAEDIDRRGTNHQIFFLRRTLRAFGEGLSFVLVDAPRAPTDGKVRSRAEEKSEGIRPWLVAYDASQLLGFRSEVVNGRWRLTQVRLYDCATEPDGDYGEKTVERVRVYDSPRTGSVTFQLWQREKDTSQKNNFEPAAETPQPVPLSNIREIPLVAFYGNLEASFFDAEPAFEELAHLNILDWQQLSDLVNILRVANVPKPYATGVQAGDLSDQIWSVDDMLTIQDPQGRILFAEHNGKQIDGLRKFIEDNRDLMRQLALEPLLPTRSVQMTDDEAEMRATEAHTPLQALALGIQDSIEQCLRYMAQFMGLGEDAGGSVEVNTKFFVSAREMRLLEALHKARTDLTRETYLTGLKRFDVLPEDLDVEQESAAVEQAARDRDLLTGALDELGADPEDGPDDPAEGTPRASEPDGARAA